MDLSALRLSGLLVGAALIGLLFWRRRVIRNADALLVLVMAVGLIVVSATDVVDGVLGFFDFDEGGGRHVLGIAVFAIAVLFLLSLHALNQDARTRRKLADVLEGIAWREFNAAGLPEQFGGKVGVVIPAYNEAASLGEVLHRIPTHVCGVETAVLVVNDGSRDGTDVRAAACGAAVAHHVTNRGQGAALRTGYRLMSESGAVVVVTLDADGQHLPEEMARLVEPVLDGEVDVAHGSRVLGERTRITFARELGAVFFNRVISLLAGTRVTDCSNGYRAVRAGILPELVFRQEQFHSSEFLLEAIKRGLPFKEVPVTVVSRLQGVSRKPASLRYGLGFGNAILRTWLRLGAAPARSAEDAAAAVIGAPHRPPAEAPQRSGVALQNRQEYAPSGSDGDT